jgi:hypothetical protein
MGLSFWETSWQIAGVLTETFSLPTVGIWEYALAALFLGLTLASVIGYFVQPVKVRRRALRGFTALVWTLLLAAAMFALPCRSLDMLPVAAVPMAAILPAIFSRSCGWITNLLYLTMLWSVLIYNLSLLFPLL